MAMVNLLFDLLEQYKTVSGNSKHRYPLPLLSRAYGREDLRRKEQQGMKFDIVSFFHFLQASSHFHVTVCFARLALTA